MVIPGKASIVRWLKFNAVGAGDSSPTIALALLLRILEFHYLWATVLAVETAVLHNFYLALEMDVGGPAKRWAQSHGSHVIAIQFFQRNDFSLWYRVVHGNSHRDFQA
jgi:hypothetical protein